ncbi:MAG: hypothetical protein LLF92_02415 [Planctomycetaceae bacterium]|nr:hypothetical protein [Planctomycetaceae bacterium]
MKKRIIVMLLAVCSMVGLANANLLTNGNFNSPDSDAAPADWSIWTWGGGWANHQNDSSSYDGTWYMAVGGSSNAGAGLYQVVKGTAGVEYTLTVDSGAQAWWKPYGEMKMFFLDASSAEISSVIAVTADPAGYDVLVPWHNVTLSAVAPVGTVSVKVEFANANGQGTVWFDNAVLIPEPISMVLLALGGLLLRKK